MVVQAGKLEESMFSVKRVGRFLAGSAVAVLMSLVMLGGASAADQAYTSVSEPSLAAGDAIPAPEGRKVLTVSGMISGTNMGDTAVFDAATLERLGIVGYTTETAWSDNPIAFEGVLFSSLLNVVGADAGATTLKITALNDYAIEIPIEDARELATVLALKADGAYMSVRDKGPLWLVYSRHINSEFGTDKYNARWIWQIATIEVK
jgi:hypothetical protein